VCPILLFADGSNVYTIHTVAGTDFVGDGGTATTAILSQPEGMAADPAGNLYIADADDCRIRKVLPSGLIQSFAGTGSAGFSGDQGPAASAALNHPYGLALDASGNLYIADLGNARIRKITPDGKIATVAGGGSLPPSFTTDGMRAIDMKLNAPRNVAVDRAGNLYIADFSAHQVYKVDATGRFSTVAGTGQAGAAQANAAARVSPLSSPAGLAVDAAGVLYIADSGNNCVRRIVNGVISTFFATAGPVGLALNSAGTLYVAAAGYFGSTSRAVGTNLSGKDVAADSAGNLYLSTANYVEKIGVDGSVSIAAGNGASRYYGGDGGPAALGRVHNPFGLVRDDLGNAYIADSGNNRIRKISAAGMLTTFAGTGELGSSTGNGQALSAQFNGPRGLAMDSMRSLYVADTGNNRICKISSSGVFTVVVAGLNAPEAIALDSKDQLYIADTGNNRIMKASATGILTKVTELLKPAGLAINAAGDLFISESVRVSKIPAGGSLTSVLEGIDTPRGLALTPSGDLIVAEAGTHRVRLVSAAGVATLLAGVGTAGFSGDGQPALLAQLDGPSGVAVDTQGNIWVSDTLNQRVRVLTPVTVGSISAPLTQISVLNAASLVPGPVAPNEIVSIFGAGFNASSTQVLFDGTAATVFYASATQINALVPASVKPGSNTDIAIWGGGAKVAEVLATVVAASPALFVSAAGSVAALNEDGTLHSVDNPAPRGSVVTLYATGWDAGSGGLTVTVGGYSADILYAGPAPGFAGLNQINIRIPAGFLAPGNQPVVLHAGSVASPSGPYLAVR
jgi:uncharacterized protein (TIGR03437 family)